MSFDDETEFDAFLHKDNYLPQVSPEAVAKALEGCLFELKDGRDSVWLAMATRRALAITMRHISDSPERASNSEIRDELERLANLAGSTWEDLFQCNHAVDSCLWSFAWSHWDGEGGTDIGDGMVMGEPSDYRRFKTAVAELDWMAGFMRQAAKATESQRGPWRNAEQKRLRIERGQYLAPVFEAAFGQPVSANNWPSGAQHKSPTPFMDYYQHMVAIAFDENVTPDLPGVLKAACKQHREHPVQFADDVIPGL